MNVNNCSKARRDVRKYSRVGEFRRLFRNKVQYIITLILCNKATIKRVCGYNP